ncbi:GAF domain-containing sensor histidine kinase [Bacillus sp. RG28]|uniref:histidine kinase n=1 Tax=Gottfriedia endophytica TaxID=2820819 RepID=A0A940NN37_9BACI|nr:GAF domain-containing sensor histidine kinase [Gottfriedia endophytica]MBP0724463.1 GAF domain-containing sensor histidine kinase [Gottfriedia endophytica]
MDKQTFLSELKILKEIAEILNHGTDLKMMLNDALAKLLQVTGLGTGWIFFIDKNGNYELLASNHLPPALLNEEFKPMCTGDCWCVDKFIGGRLQKASNIMECKRLEDSILQNWGETWDLTHHATVPLFAGEEQFGLLNVASPHKTHFEQEELDLLSSVALQIGTAIKRILLTQKEQEIKLIEERNRLAKDLHDSVSQLLFSVSLSAKAGMTMSKEVAIKDTFSQIHEIAQNAQAEMKALIWQLHPKGLENGILSALKNYGEMIGLTVQIECNGISSLPSTIEEALWRIGQEAFNNCKKHSNQQNVILQLTIKDNNVKMVIIDYGTGFNSSVKKELPSLGLKNMKERTEKVSGTFSIKSKIGKGTKIEVKIPL